MSKNNKNLRAKTFFGTSSTVIGASAMYLALSNSGLVSADSNLIAQNPATFMAVLICGAFLLVVGAMVLLFVFASK